MTHTIFFYVFAGILVAASLSVVLNRQPVYSVLSLLVAMLCLAALFVMLGAFFVAALQILLYAGAVLVLFLFVIMLLNLAPETLPRMRPLTRRGLGLAAAVLFVVEWVWLLNQSPLPVTLPKESASLGSVEEIGRQLFTTYLLPFELTSFLILAAIIGAVTLAKGLWDRE